MKLKLSWPRLAQFLVVLAGAYLLKRFYATASADELRWLLAPTALLVELVSGVSFEFESRAGYLSRERGFLIANSCAGVNFLITAFLMLALRRLRDDQAKNVAWRFLPRAALAAYFATLIANTVRISFALWMQRTSLGMGWWQPAQLHRFEGVVIYFGALLLLFAASEKLNSERAARLLERPFFPLFVYYAMTLGLPLLNGAYRQGTNFWAHARFVLVIPWLLILPITALRFYRQQRMFREVKWADVFPAKKGCYEDGGNRTPTTFR